MANRIIIFIVALFMVSCGQKSNFVAQIDGWGNDTIIAIYRAWGASSEITDTLVAVNGRIEYNTPVLDTAEVLFTAKKSMHPRSARPMLLIGTSILTIMTPTSQESVSGKLEGKKLTYKSTGSKFYRDNSIVRAEYLAQALSMDSLTIVSEDAREGKIALTKEQTEEMSEKRMALNDQISNIKLQSVKSNLTSDLSAYLLLQLSTEKITEYLPLLSPEVRSGFFKRQLDQTEQRIKDQQAIAEAKLKIVVGADAPNFTLTALDGTQKSLSEFKGKWVVLDFWGSWCGWCIVGFPDLKEAYAKYGNRLEIIGVACRDTDDAWRKAVAEHKLDWVQLINSTEPGKSIPVMYGVSGYPTKLIITPELKIANITVGEDPNFYVELEKLVKTK